eukprot:5134950-Prorocentrum_lima.AAC.1
MGKRDCDNPSSATRKATGRQGGVPKWECPQDDSRCRLMWRRLVGDHVPEEERMCRQPSMLPLSA